MQASRSHSAQGVPGWVGNGSYFSDDNVQYQADFVAGALVHHNISVDYIGIWNERSWGDTTYVQKLRSALDAAGAQSTAIVGSDSVRNLPPDLLSALRDDAIFSSVVGIAGVHYACNRTAPPSFWSLKVCIPRSNSPFSGCVLCITRSFSLPKPFGPTRTLALLQIGPALDAGAVR